jgi:oligopeptidase A
MSNTNPLLHHDELPRFSQIKASDMQPAIATLIARNREALVQLLKQEKVSWQNVIAPFEEMEDELHNAWSPISHLHSVADNEERRAAYNACLPILTEYETELGQNKALFKVYKTIYESDEFKKLSNAQQTTIEHALRDFKLSGIDLPEKEQQRFAEIMQKLSELTSRFSEHVMDATDAWSKLITDKNQLQGLPDNTIAAARETAAQKEQEGYLLTLDFPCYYAVMSYADNRALREEMYRAYTTRASDQGPQAGQFDNSQLMNDILALRQEEAKLLGFDNYAQYSLATKMATTPDQVIHFLEDLAEKSLSMAKQELNELTDFAKTNFNIETLEAWDIGYYSEKLQQHSYSFSQEDLRPYFPIDKVLSGLFSIINQLFDVTFNEIATFDSWHEEVRFFELKRNNEVIGKVFIDLYARAQKQGGAWMGECRGRRRTLSSSLQLPVAYVVCNFSKGVADKPALLTHDEVTTLFHEFGHALHHLLTKMDVPAVAGINGVAWDAVELPSQFLENWCWEPDALKLISSHYQTGQTLPSPLLKNMLAAKNFQAGMQMMRQIEFSLFDFKLHQIFEMNKTNIQQLLNTIRQKTSVRLAPEFNRFQHSFSHIFAGGYAAGYYSYKWAEVLSADAFGAFEEEGIFNPKTGRRFLNCILEKGGSEEPMELFKAFRGREPSIEALLRHSGIDVGEIA